MFRIQFIVSFLSLPFIQINKNTQSNKNLGEHKRWIHDPSSE